jgi:hypothetical protein
MQCDAIKQLNFMAALNFRVERFCSMRFMGARSQRSSNRCMSLNAIGETFAYRPFSNTTSSSARQLIKQMSLKAEDRETKCSHQNSNNLPFILPLVCMCLLRSLINSSLSLPSLRNIYFSLCVYAWGQML